MKRVGVAHKEKEEQHSNTETVSRRGRRKCEFMREDKKRRQERVGEV